MAESYRLPFLANQVMKYFHVFIPLLMAIYLAAVRVMASHQATHVITLTCHMPSFWPCKLCPTAIKH